MVQMMKDDLGVEINPQAWRMFLRYRWERFAPLAHRIHGAHVRNARDEAIEAARRDKQREDLWKGKL